VFVFLTVSVRWVALRVDEEEDHLGAKRGSVENDWLWGSS